MSLNLNNSHIKGSKIISKRDSSLQLLPKKNLEFIRNHILEALGLKRVKKINDCKNTNSISIFSDNNNTTKSNTLKLYKCTRCNIKFDCLNKYDEHCKKQHLRSKIVYCKICSRTFTNAQLLLKHKKCHTGNKPYHCIHCSQKFATLQSLTVHIRRHTGKAPYTCKICKSTFSTYSDHFAHQHVHKLRQYNYKQRTMYICATCSKQFPKKCDLRRHIRVHTGDKPYKCEICKNCFQQAHNLTKHMIIHTKRKLHKCEICNKEFGRSDVLTRHMITHAVHKPHPCKFCAKSFGRLSQLHEHLKKYHIDN